VDWPGGDRVRSPTPEQRNALKPLEPHQFAARLLALLVFCLSLWRAGTQSIAGDEAFAYELFVSSHPAKLFNHYDASHHVLYAILQKISVTLLGVSEFTLRLPALGAAAWYLSVVVRLCHRLFGPSPRLVLGVGLLALNPLVFDFLSAARGYGLALAFFGWALEQMWLWTDAPSEKPAYRAAAGLALSVASNLTFVFPSVPVALVFLAALLTDRRAAGKRWRMTVECFVIPGIVIAFVILVMPLVHARREHFYVGHPRFTESLRALTALSLFPHPKPWASSAETPWVRAELQLIQWLLLPALLVSAAGTWLAAVWRAIVRNGMADAQAALRLHLFAGGALLGALGMLVPARLLFDLPYPHGRTGLYLIVLATLCALTVWRLSDGRRVTRWIAVPAWAVSLILLSQYLLFLQTRHYTEWRYDARSKTVAAILRARGSVLPPPVRVAASPFLEPSLNFYRKLWRLEWMAPITRQGADQDADFYVLLGQDHALIARRKLAVLFRDSLANVVLAAPRDRMAAQ
jgi:hypothetical protein